MVLRGISLVGAMLALCLAFSPVSAWALSPDELLNLLVDEKVISPEKAEKIKQKAQVIEKREKAQDEARRAKELERVKQEAKAEAKTEAVKEAKAVAKEAAKPAWRVYWKEGLHAESTDGKFKAKVGGRIQWDVANISSPTRQFVDQVSAGGGGTNRLTGTGTEFRRARVYLEGTVYEDIFYKAQYDFAGAGVAFKDVYLGVKNIPYLGHIRVGQMKVPWSLEEQTSSNFITFMERALPNAFTEDRKPGGMIYNTAFNKRLYWAAGVFTNTINRFADTDAAGDAYQNFQNWDIAARIAGTPLYEDQGTRLIHLGFSYRHDFRNDNPNAFTLRYRARPEAHITDVRTVDTAAGISAPAIATGGIDVINPEFALVWGPFSLQAEYMLSLVDASRNTFENRNLFLTEANPTFQGAYVYASYFLTGEHRNYKQSDACFDRIKPKHNFNIRGGGWGAWEVAARWSYLNLQSKGILGGVENDMTLGLNWYLTPNARWMFNYVYADIQHRAVVPRLPTYRDNNIGGVAHIAQTRFQVDF